MIICVLILHMRNRGMEQFSNLFMITVQIRRGPQFESRIQIMIPLLIEYYANIYHNHFRGKVTIH